MKKFLIILISSLCSLIIASCDNTVSPENINGWWRQDGGYIIFKAMKFNNDGTVNRYFRVIADHESDWEEWDDVEELPDHDDYYYGTHSSGKDKYVIEEEKIIINDKDELILSNGKLVGSDGTVFRRW